jgi:putative nucleotidyltransferase with HDIG domain
MKSSRSGFLSRAREILQRIRLEKWTTISVACAFVAACAVVLAATLFRAFSAGAGAGGWTAGAVAEKDFVVERDFQYVDEAATEQRRDAQADLVPPVFTLNELVTATALQSFDRFTQSILRQVRQGASEDRIAQTIQVDFPDAISREDMHLLLSSRQPATTLDHARSLIETTLARGVVDLLAHQDEAERAGAIELRSTEEGSVQSEQIPLDRVQTTETLGGQIDQRAREASLGDAERRLVAPLVVAFTPDNAFYDANTTLVHRNRARSDVTPVTEKLARGQVLVRRGDIISEGTADRIRALGAYSRTVDLNRILGSVFFLLIVFAVSLYLLTLKGTGLRRSHVYLVLGMGLGHLGLGALIVRFVALPDWIPAAVAIPTSAMSMLVAILVATPAGVFFSLVVSLALLLVTSLGIQAFLFSFLSGVAATAVVLNAEKRIDLVRAGLILALADALILLLLGLLANDTPGMVLGMMAGGLANGFGCGILTLGFLPVFEMLLNAPTRFKLMELSDLNSPIFRRMLSLAPGTYTHSISVANLAETACEAIGANALLARVSAYYHDIGKVDQADYFVENQKAYNRHDELRPSLSVAVIKSHLRIGIEKAHELNLPQAIIDIIAQHHGRGLITYFYDRAVKEGRNPRVSRDDYSYAGVRPRSKEAAVLMLADTVEAASRTLKRPTEARLDKFVHDMIMEKFTSGELGDSILTLRDLELIRKSFVHILEGYFHTRIEYPKLTQARGGRA